MCEDDLQQSFKVLIELGFGPRCKARALGVAWPRSVPLSVGSAVDAALASSFIPGYRSPRAGKARLTVPRCLQSLRLISPSAAAPQTLSAFFHSVKQLEGDLRLLSSTRGWGESERMRKTEGIGGGGARV